MTYDYVLCGWRVRSAFEVPQLLPWTGDDRPVDVSFVEGEVPERFEHPLAPGHWTNVDAEGSTLVNIPDLVRFLVRGGNSVTVQVLKQEEAYGWRVFLLGSVLGHLCHQRRLFPLHAATVKIGGRYIAIAGHAGAGKSTLALALLQRGHGLLSDDVTVLDIGAEKGGQVLPAFPRLKLWDDSCRALGLEPERLPRLRDALDKYNYSQPAAFDPTPASLDAIVILDQKEPAMQLTPQPASGAVVSVLSYVFRRRIAHFLGHDALLFAQAARLCSGVQVMRFSRPKEFEQLRAAAALIDERFAE